MATFETTPDRLGVLIKEHEQKRRENVFLATRAAARRAASIIRDNTPIATKELQRSISIENVGKNVEVVLRAPHAIFVELGCRPHMPPVPPLIRWAEAKGFDDPRDVAWRVAKKISREGIKPTNFVRNSLPEIARATKEQVELILHKGP